MLTPSTGATIEESESLGVASLLSLTDAVRRVGAPSSLLFARINWAGLQGKPSVSIGAPAPRVARSTYTREARRQQRQRQLARRSGRDALLRSLRSL